MFSCSFLNHATSQQRRLTTCPTKSALMAAFLSHPPSLPQPPLPPPPPPTDYVMSSSHGLPPRCCRGKCLRCACQGWDSLLTLPPRRRRELPQHYPSPASWSLYTVAPRGSNTSPPSSHLARGPSAVVPSDQRPDSSLPPTVCLYLPSLTTIFHTPCPTLKHVPKGVRDSWARVVSECLSAVCDAPTDLSRWSKLFMLAKCVLATLTNPSPFLLSPASVTPRIPPCHQISPSPEEASVSSAAPSDQPPTVKRSCRTGSQGLGSLWPRCMICRTPNWRPPSCVHVSPPPNSPTSFAPPL